MEALLPESSVTTYHSTFPNIPEDVKLQICGSLNVFVNIYFNYIPLLGYSIRGEHKRYARYCWMSEVCLKSIFLTMTCSFAYSIQSACLYSSTALQKECPDDSHWKEQNFEYQVLIFKSVIPSRTACWQHNCIKLASHCPSSSGLASDL